MRVKITYILNNDPTAQHLEDVLNWPDLETLEAVTPFASTHLDQKCGTGQHTIVTIEAA